VPTAAFTDTDGMLRASAHGAHALFTARAGGVSTGPYASLNLGPRTGDASEAIDENRRIVEALASDPQQPRRLLIGEQVHESSVAAHVEGFDEVNVDGVDAHVTDRRDLAVAVLTADCIPVALLAPWGVGVAHAGWRGLAGGVVGGTVGELLSLGDDDADPSQISAFIGPCAGACCYEVGEEVHAAFLGWPGHDPAARTIDLAGLAAAALAHEQVGEIHIAGRCTICDERYFSHRASGGTTGRQAGIAWRA
jgi:YfiH family protein